MGFMGHQLGVSVEDVVKGGIFCNGNRNGKHNATN